MSIPGSASPLLLASTAAAAAGYQVSRSLRFNSADSAYLSRTPAVAGDRRTWTWAGWVKRSALGAINTLFFAGTSPTNEDLIRFESDRLQILWYYGGVTANITTTPVYRDPSAWMHVVVSVDTTQATASNRIKVYINGTQGTTLTTATYPTQNTDSLTNATNAHNIGRDGGNVNFYLNGYLADIHFIDGQALTPSSFTEVSATTGQLIPKAYAGTYTGNSFWLKFSDNSAATAATLGKDSFLLGNNWTPNNLAIWNGGAAMYSVGSLTNNLGYLFTTSGVLPAASFDGSLLTWAGNNNGGGTNTWTAPVSITVNTSLRVYVGAGAFPASTTWAVNGTSQGSTTNGAWLTSSVSTPYTLTSVANTLSNSSTGAFFAAIEVDGVILVDKTNSTNDSLVDTPTSYGTDTGVGGEVRGNYCVINPLTGVAAGRTVSNGNLEQLALVESVNSTRGTIGVKSGKWYWEVTVYVTSGGGVSPRIGICRASAPDGYSPGNGADEWCLFMTSYDPYGGAGGHNGGVVGSYAPIYPNDIGMFALDMDNAKIYFGKNGTWLNSGNPVSGVGAFFSDVTGEIFPMINTGYFTSVSCNFGQRAFAYTAPSGFKALVDTNLPAPLVAKPNTVMDVALWTGNNTARTISGLNFSPDLVWIKNRSTAQSHTLYDTVRGATLALVPNGTDAELTLTNFLTAFTSDGFSIGTDNNLNGSGNGIVGWAWDAGTSTASNTAGSITSQVRANVSAGFSVQTWTASGSGIDSWGHGLGIAPEFVIAKRRSSAQDWYVWHKSITSSQYLLLNSTASVASYTNIWGASGPSSSLVYYAASPGNQVSYAFAPVVGFSSFGSYTGNGSADGPFVYNGFRPRWVLIRRTDTSENWILHDTARDTYNVTTKELIPNSSGAEGSSTPFDILSNGFKMRDSGGGTNGSGGTYIYAAFAENPFQYARAR